MVLSRSVTSCAGMTAKVTIIAQTRIGFLSGLRRFAGGEEAEDAYDVQREEAAARATVALTRAKELCVILGPLDMLGLVGAATVIGSLMYGVGLCWQQDLEFHYQHKELGGDMEDEQMVQQLKDAGACSELPPLALAEVVHLIDDDFQVRRLHLIMVTCGAKNGSLPRLLVFSESPCEQSQLGHAPSIQPQFGYLQALVGGSTK